MINNVKNDYKRESIGPSQKRKLFCENLTNIHGNTYKARNSKWKWVKVMSLSRVGLFATPWTVAYQAPPSMGLSRQEYWSGVPFPSPGHLPDPGIEPRSPRNSKNYLHVITDVCEEPTTNIFIGLHPAGLQVLYLPTFKTEGPRVSNRDSHGLMDEGIGELQVWSKILEQHPTPWLLMTGRTLLGGWGAGRGRISVLGKLSHLDSLVTKETSRGVCPFDKINHQLGPGPSAQEGW